MIQIAADADLPFHLVVIGRHVRVVDRPIDASALITLGFEISMTQSQSNGIPQEGFSTDTVRTRIFESLESGNHHRHLAVPKLVRHPMSVEGSRGVNFGSSLYHDDI